MVGVTCVATGSTFNSSCCGGDGAGAASFLWPHADWTMANVAMQRTTEETKALGADWRRDGMNPPVPKAWSFDWRRQSDGFLWRNLNAGVIANLIFRPKLK